MSGTKNETVRTAGPYFVVRNPLHRFNFLGALGLGLIVENPLLSLLLAGLFAVFIHPS